MINANGGGTEQKKDETPRMPAGALLSVSAFDAENSLFQLNALRTGAHV